MKPLLTQVRQWYRAGWITEEEYLKLIKDIEERYVKKSNGEEYRNGDRVGQV